MSRTPEENWPGLHTQKAELEKQGEMSTSANK